MLNNYVVTHLHSTMSNGTMMDSSTNFQKYIDIAIKNNMKAIAFTEHGNVFNWIQKKMACDKAGIKYIHGEEFYSTTTVDEKIRETFHICLYARNWNGVKELNKLSSLSFNKEDNHYYYRPRISLEEIMNTSKNILISTACLASILWVKKGEPVVEEFLEWMSENKDRCFLEIQYHNCQEQKEYNSLLYEHSKKYKLRLLSATDTHAGDEEDAELRKVLQLSKGIKFPEEEAFDLTFKTYKELVQEFKNQKCLPEEVYLEAINNTNIMADMVEDFELDMSHKYPKIYEDPNAELKKRINRGVANRNLNNWESISKKKYYQRIKEEFDVFNKLGMLDYILLLDDIIDFCRKNGISTAPRGSCNGSQILWSMGITDIDSIKFDLPFFRFCNPERVSLGDVDIDMASIKRPLVKDFIYTYPNIQGSAIITFQTYALRGAIKGIGRGLNIPLSEVESISADIDEIEEEDDTGESKKITTFHNKEKWENKYPKLLKMAYRCLGVIENISTHACGFVATDRNIDEEIGTFKTDKCKWVISQNNMKCIDSVNFVKMDLLVVDNVQIVEDTCKLAEIPILNNDEIDFEDISVWDEMLKSGLGIFQFEKTGFRHLKHTLENFEEFQKQVSNISRLDVMTALNGIIRPSGDSIRDYFVSGKPYKSGMKEIDDSLGETLSYCIYQEQIMMWLHNFCGYSMAQSDIVRRGIAKKYGTEKLIPDIEKGFMTFCTKTYPQYSEEYLRTVLAKFIQVILDASLYGFSKNHSNPYSILGFKCAYLRHYYPLEFLTVQFNINDGRIEKTSKINDFMNKFTDIKVRSIKFRKSKSEYTCDKEARIIYKGIKSIKYLSESVANELFELGKQEFNSYLDLLIAITEKTSVNSRQMDILIKLNFFEEFGGNRYLLDIYKLFASRYKKTYVEKTKIKRIEEINNEILNISNVSFGIKEQLQYEKEFLGFPQSTFDMDSDFIYVSDIDLKYSPKVMCYYLKNGYEECLKILKSDYKQETFDVGDIIKLGSVISKPKAKKVDVDLTVKSLTTTVSGTTKVSSVKDISTGKMLKVVKKNPNSENEVRIDGNELTFYKQAIPFECSASYWSKSETESEKWISQYYIMK